MLYNFIGLPSGKSCLDAGCSLSFKAIESMDKAADPMAGGSCSETVPATLSHCSTLYTVLNCSTMLLWAKAWL